MDHSIFLDGLKHCWPQKLVSSLLQISYLKKTEFVLWEESKSKHCNQSFVVPRVYPWSSALCNQQALLAILSTNMEYNFDVMLMTLKSTFLFDQTTPHRRLNLA